MTLLTVFTRRIGSRRELVFASDSRLGGNGQRMDYGQKLFEMPRSDALAAFAGDTQYAYPLMMQMLRAIEGAPFSVDRRLPLPRLKGHTLRVFQQTYEAIHGLSFGERYPAPPDNFFLLGGFDWQTQAFHAWELSFDEADREFVFRRVVRRGGWQFYFAGDNTEAIKRATSRTQQLLGARKKTAMDIDMEPFEALCEIINDPTYDSIGGAPQLGKVYAHLNTQLFQVLWPTVAGPTTGGLAGSRGHVAGRPLLPTERSTWPVYDPERGFYTSWGDPLMEDVSDENEMDEIDMDAVHDVDPANEEAGWG